MPMKAILAAFAALVTLTGPALAEGVSPDCTLKGVKLWGKVKVVDSFPDLKVKRVTSFPGLKVKTVTSFADSCGKWRYVDSFPDFTIQWVTSFPDLEIEPVESFPGLP